MKRSSQEKYNNLLTKSFLALLIIALMATLSFSVIAQDNNQEKIELIRGYISDSQVESLNRPLTFILERNFDENNEIPLDFTYSLIDEYAEGNIGSGDVYAAVYNVNRIQNSGVSIENIEEFTNNTENVDNHGMLVSSYAHELAGFARDISREDGYDNKGELISEMARELSALAADKGEITSEEMRSVRERKRGEIMRSKGRRGAPEGTPGYGASASGNASGNMPDQASDNKPDTPAN